MGKGLDKLHKTAVTALMGLTVVASATFGVQLYEYFSTTRPRKQQTLPAKENEHSELTEHSSRYRMTTISRMFKFLQATKLSTVISCACSTSEKPAWNILRVNHLAVATKNLDKTVKFYKDVLGAKTSEPVPMPEHGVTTVFVELLNTKIELLLPFGSESPINNFLEKNSSGGMHHICLEVDNIQNAVEDLRAKNIRLLSDKPKIGAHGKPVVFLHPKDCGGVLIELEEV